MANYAQQVVQKLWNYCNILRDEGMPYGDYVEQLTYLLFLKMSYERELLHYEGNSLAFVPLIPESYNWKSLLQLDGLKLVEHYREILEKLGEAEGMLGIIFRKAQNKIQN